GLAATAEELLDLSGSYRAGQLKTFVEVRFPMALPFFVSGLQVAVTLAVIGAVVGVVVGSDKGLGGVILSATAYGKAGVAFVVAARANEDTKVKSIAVYFRETWLSIFVRTDSGINSPKDLEGKTISTTPGNAHHVLWPLYAQLAGLNGDSVK